MKITCSVESGIAQVVLDSPPLNLVTQRTYDLLDEVLVELEPREDLRALVLAGAGRRAFSAGADLREVRAAQESSPAERWERADRALGRLRDFQVPTIAAINGHALGAGLVLAAACMVRVASTDASLGLPEVRLGLSGGVSSLVAAGVSAPWADWMVVSGHRVDAATALGMGLVQFVAEDDARDRACELAASLEDIERGALVANTALVGRVRQARGAAARDAERQVFEGRSSDDPQGVRTAGGLPTGP